MPRKNLLEIWWRSLMLSDPETQGISDGKNGMRDSDAVSKQLDGISVVWWQPARHDSGLQNENFRNGQKTEAIRSATSRLQKYVHRMPAYVGSQEICPCLNTPLFPLLSVLTGAWGHSKVPNAGEGPPTLQSTGHSRMELRPPTAKKSHPNFFAHCKRSTKMTKYKKNIIPNVQITMRTQVTPMVSNHGKIMNKMTCFTIKTPLKRMIHVCLGKISFFVAKCILFQCFKSNKYI